MRHFPSWTWEIRDGYEKRLTEFNLTKGEMFVLTILLFLYYPPKHLEMSFC